MKRSWIPPRKHPMKRGRPKWAKQKPSALIAEWKSWVHTCIGCRKVSGVPADPDCSIDPHHRLKVSKGGDDSHTNLAPLCWQCHRDFHAAEKHPKGWLHGLAEWIRTHGGGDLWKPGPSLAVNGERIIQLVDDFFDTASEEEVDALVREAKERTTPEDIEMWGGPESDFYPLPDEPEDEIKPCTEAIDDARFDELAGYFAEKGREFREGPR